MQLFHNLFSAEKRKRTFEQLRQSEFVKQADYFSEADWVKIISNTAKGEFEAAICRQHLRIVNQRTGGSLEARHQYYNLYSGDVWDEDETFFWLLNFLAISDQAWSRLMSTISAFNSLDAEH